jgi:hypothetical protein
MNPKIPRPPAPAGQRAGDSKGLGGTFDFQNSEILNQKQDDDRLLVPNAQTRIVFGAKASFIYIPCCPLCGLEHAHGLFPYPHSNPLQAYDSCGGYRASHCFTHGLERVAKTIRGEWHIVRRRPPPEYKESEGDSYRLIPGPEPACFTRCGILSADAKAAVARLVGIPKSLEVLKPRRAFILERGD